MSSKRIALSCTLMALGVAAGSWYAVGAFPLKEAAQELRREVGPLEARAKPITPENPVPRRIYSIDPAYPIEAASVEANALVTVMITLDQSGRVAEVRRLGVAPIANPTPNPNAPDAESLSRAYDALVQAAADAVHQWQYDAPANAPLSIRVTLAFPSTGSPRLVAHDGWFLAPPGQNVGLRAGSGPGGTSGSSASPPPPPPPPPPSDPDTAPAWANGALRVGGAVLQPVKTKHVSPAYPQIAQDSKVQGVVILEALIGVEGKVTNARVLRSVPLLDQAALDAVMQWEFTPTRLNGQLVPVMMTVTVQFTLS
jgi:TonB family protein